MRVEVTTDLQELTGVMGDALADSGDQGVSQHRPGSLLLRGSAAGPHWCARARQAQTGPSRGILEKVDIAIETSRLTKTFGQVRALNGLDLRVRTGEVHGFLGPNGAGKSSTLRILLGLIRATSGQARVLGADPWSQSGAVHARLAYVPGDVVLWPNLTGGEIIDLLTSLRGTPPSADARAHRERLVRDFDLDLTKKGRAYSKGNRQKVALIAALASDAELFLLDEPTAGMAPAERLALMALTRRWVDQNGSSVLFTEHSMDVVFAFADRIVVLAEGRVIADGKPQDVRRDARVQQVYFGSGKTFEHTPQPEGGT